MLTFTFADGVVANLDELDEYSPFIRMQRVRLNASGSLKLGGVLDNDGTGGSDQVVSEPPTIVIWPLLGLMGLCFHCRKLRQANKLTPNIIASSDNSSVTERAGGGVR